MRRVASLLLVWGILGLTLVERSLATNRYVAVGGSDTAPYTNWTTAASNIQAAVNACSAGDTIWVSNGTYTSTGPVTNGAMISITNAITLRSVNGAGATVVDGGYPAVTNRCLYLSHASAVVEGFTFRNGYATGTAPLDKGGGVYVNANGTLRNSLIVSNSATGDGGGVYVATNGTVESCTISTNIATGNGGGVFVASAATLRNSIIYFNAAGSSANYSGGTYTYTCTTPLPGGTGNTASDPLFVSFAGGDLHLATNSPCINVGLFQSWMTGGVDLDGQPRLLGVVDLGVDEYTRFFYVSTAGTNTNAGTQGSPWGTIRYAVTNASIRPGDTILIGEGTYVENVTFPNPGSSNGLTIKGGHDTNDWSWAPATHATIIKSSTNTSDVLYLRSLGHMIMGVTLTGGRYGAYADYGADTRYTFSHCIISNNAIDGIYTAANPIDFLIKNCLIVRNGGHGIRYQQDGGSSYIKEIHNCTIADNGGTGIYDNYQYGRSCYVYNTIIANNAYGISRPGGPVFTLSSSCVYSNRIDDFGRVDVPAITFGSGNMNAYPAFVGGDDYHLQNGSPCVDYGQDLSASGVTDDMEGNPRTGLYDMGCYQSSYAAATRYATTYADATKADESGDGSSWATAKKTIGTALAFTSSGGTCNVAAGVYHEAVFVPANITVAGTNRDLTIVTSGWHAVSMLANNATIQRLTLTGGYRGVDIQADNNTVQECVLRGNTNGLVQNRPGTRVFECCITSNLTYGIWGNGITGPGGVGLTVRNCLIARNASSGAYINWDNGGANGSQWWNCTIVSNGQHGYQANTYNSMAYFTNSTLARNNGYGTYVSTWGSAKQYLDYSCVYGNTSGAHTNNSQTPVLGANMIASDPKLAGDFRLTSSSPCIDAGKDLTAAGVTNDLDGAARTNAFDIGCYESAFPPPPKYNIAYVDASAIDDSGDGTNWLSAKKTIGAGLSILTPTGTCYIASGGYGEGVSIAANITLAGTNRDTTVISNSGSVVTMASTNSRLREVTVLGGTHGIAMPGAKNVAERCILRNNSSSGAYITGDSNRLDQCVVRNNLYGAWGGTVNLMFTLDHCIVQSNTSHGVYQTWNGCAQLLNTLIANNGGDGLSSWTDNAIYNTYIYNCTVVSNTGHGFYDNYLTRYPLICNSIIAFNGQNGIHQALNGHYTMYVTNSCVYGNSNGNFRTFLGGGGGIRLGPGNFTANPLFVGGGDYHLQANSPCIGYGTTNGMLTLCAQDLDLTSRADPFDMGCYESSSSPVPRSAAIYVNGTTGSETAAGTNAATAKKTIGSGLALTAPNGTCYVAAGTYSDTMVLPARVTVEGEDRDTTIVTGGWCVAYLPETNSIVRQLTLQNGLYGVYLSGKFGTVDQCVLRQNNIGMYVDGQYTLGWNALINRSLVTNNTTHGVFVSQAGVTARNSLFAKNGGDGLLIVADNSQVYSFMDYCTFADNGGNGYADWHASHWRTTLTNCISSGNVTNGIRFQRINNDVIAYSCVYSNAGGDFNSLQLTIGSGMITNAAPRFFKTTYLLAEDSPAVDTGADIGITNDLRGFLRPIITKKPPVGSSFDMGCYETLPAVKGTVFVMH